MFSWKHRLLWSHPGTARLLDFVSGSSREGPMDQVARHAQGCPRCRQQLEQLQREWNRLVELEAAIGPPEPPDLDALLPGLLAAVRASLAAEETSLGAERVSKWLAAELEAYFGVHAAELVPVPGGGVPQLRQTVASGACLLSTFLGRHTATRFTDAVLAQVGSLAA
jgi:hypothetical protein